MSLYLSIDCVFVLLGRCIPMVGISKQVSMQASIADGYTTSSILEDFIWSVASSVVERQVCTFQDVLGRWGRRLIHVHAQ